MLKKEIESIKERNLRVEADKAWETSTTRKVIIVLLTYGIVVLFLVAINAPNPWTNAIIPVIGFWISTITLPIIKRWWISRVYKR